MINPLNAELNPIFHLLALLGAHHILHVSRIRVKLTLASHNFANVPKMSVCAENIFKEIHSHESLEARKLYLFHCSHVASSF